MDCTYCWEPVKYPRGEFLVFHTCGHYLALLKPGASYEEI